MNRRWHRLRPTVPFVLVLVLGMVSGISLDRTVLLALAPPMAVHKTECVSRIVHDFGEES